jgi:hypothetical protein
VANLFDTDRCGLPVIPRVDVDFVQGCAVPPAPAAIFDAPDPGIFFTPAVDTCPTFEGEGTVTVFQDGSPEGAVTINVEPIDSTDGCRNKFVFDFQIPLICPTITATGATVTKTDCNYDFAFSLPCPTFASTAAAELSFVIAAPMLVIEMVQIPPLPEDPPGEPCKYQLAADLKIPNTRVFRGILQSEPTDCVEMLVVDVYDGETTFVTVDANRWLRGCCTDRPLTLGTRVWLNFSLNDGWTILAHEDVTIAPIKLTSDMADQSAAAVFYYNDTESGGLFVQDPNNDFPCAMEGALGWAACNATDGGGEWRIVQLTQKALWIEFTLNLDLCEDVAQVRANVDQWHHGDNPNPGGGTFFIKNTLGFEGKGGVTNGIALRRGGGSMESCDYVIIAMRCPPEDFDSCEDEE